MTIVEFLEQRVAEDEAVAMRASPGPWTYGDIESVAGGSLYDTDQMIASILWDNDDTRPIRRPIYEREADANGAYMASHDPVRVLAECAAKRRIMEAFEYREERAGESNVTAAHATGLLMALRMLVVVYSGHTDYRPEWRLDQPT
jgi:Family of unknown function (DUF6221)